METLTHLPEGLASLSERLLDPTLSREDRSGLLTIAENLSKQYTPFGPRGSNQGWEECLYRISANGAQVLNTVTETVMVPDFLLNANYLTVGKTLKYTVYFDISTVITTPGTITLALRWGGVSGVVLCTSGAYAPDPTAASTAVSGMVEFLVTGRSEGTAGTAFAMGNMVLNDYDDATVTTITGNLNMIMIPPTGPAVSGAIDTTTQKALSPTVKFSVATATTQFTAHLATLEALN